VFRNRLQSDEQATTLGKSQLAGTPSNEIGRRAWYIPNDHDMGFLLNPWGIILQALALVHFIRRRPDTYWLWIIIF